MKTLNKTTLGVLSLLMLGACSAAPAGEPPAHFGNAVRQNVAAQIANPDAVNLNRTMAYDGSRTAVSQTRYMTDKVEKPEATSTSSVNLGGQ